MTVGEVLSFESRVTRSGSESRVSRGEEEDPCLTLPLTTSRSLLEAKRVKRPLSILMALFVSACSLTETRQTPAPVVEAGSGAAGEPLPASSEPEAGEAQVFAYRAAVPQTRKTSDAADALAEESERQRAAGDKRSAAATLERALRIDPDNAHLWNRLARLRLEQGQYTQAGDLAAKSNALAGDSPSLKQDNWRIIALVRRRAGDHAGADSAQRQSDSYR